MERVQGSGFRINHGRDPSTSLRGRRRAALQLFDHTLFVISLEGAALSAPLLNHEPKINTSRRDAAHAEKNVLFLVYVSPNRIFSARPAPLREDPYWVAGSCPP